MKGEINKEELNLLLQKAVDCSSQVIYFPVRHHSPICSIKLLEIIEEFKPENILVEGPYDFNDRIDLLSEVDSVPPFAIYSFFVDTGNILGKNGILTAKLNEPARYRAWYPFTDYSPELVALREGKRRGLKTLFIDLPYSEMVRARNSSENLDNDISSEGKNSFNDYLLQQSSYVKLLCKNKGCRNYHDLWDSIFEIGCERLAAVDFIKSFLTFCYLSRVDYPPEMLEREGCHKREAFMAANISNILKEGKKTLVITGGFHTVALPFLVEENIISPSFPSYNENQCASYLTRYSFELMDRYKGYESGMPSPAYYQEVWSLYQNGEREAFSAAALKFITDIARKSRKDGHAVSTSEAIEAYNLSLNLSSFRSRNQISRFDLLDAIGTAFIKGSLSDGGYNKILKIAHGILQGTSIGAVTEKAGHPPLVRDFYKKIKEFSLENLSSQRKEVKLDLYRKAIHRKKSQFFHRLNFLGIFYGYLIKGPDFVRGRNLNLIFELWEIIWNPDIESSLIEKSLYGSTVFEASASLLCEKMALIENKTDKGASLLLDACRMGLQSYIKSLIDIIFSILDKDNDFKSIVSAMGDLCIVYKYREALDAIGLESLIPLIETCYKQAIYIIGEIVKTGPEKQKEIFKSFRDFHYIVISFKDAFLDKELYVETLKMALELKDGSPLMRGAFAGVLYSFKEISEEEIGEELSGYIKGSPEYLQSAADFIEGILVSAKYILFEVSSFFSVIHKFLLESDEDAFLTVLPGFRRACTVFTPRETEIMGKKIARYLGIEEEKLSLKLDIPFSVTAAGAKIDKKVTELMKEMGVLEK